MKHVVANDCDLLILPLHLSQFPNVHWKFVSCAFDVDEFMYEVFTIFFCILHFIVL